MSSIGMLDSGKSSGRQLPEVVRNNSVRLIHYNIHLFIKIWFENLFQNYSLYVFTRRKRQRWQHSKLLRMFTCARLSSTNRKHQRATRASFGCSRAFIFSVKKSVLHVWHAYFIHFFLVCRKTAWNDNVWWRFLRLQCERVTFNFSW